VDVKEDGSEGTADLTVDPGKALTLKVQDADGEPLAGALASGVSAMPRTVLALRDDACPVFALDPERPRQLVLLHPEKKLFGSVTLRGDEKEPPTVRLAPGATLSGRLLDADGRPVAGADIYLRYGAEAAQSLVNRDRRASAAHTDKEGRFSLEGIVPGVKLTLNYIKDREPLIEVKQSERGPFKSAEATDLGDVRVKPRTQGQ
jgi:hypothetical protein